MNETKDDNFFLDKIKRDTSFILKYSVNLSLEDYLANELLQDSMMFRLIQISENSLRLSEEFKENYRTISWMEIKGLRNRIVHEYGKVDLTIIFDTICIDILELNNLLNEIETVVNNV